ncbi:5-methylthioadenosine/S-adenosylhomocysteine deaminase [Balamuthia mandrillaris]
MGEQVSEVVHARWIVPIVPDNCVLERHSLVIHQGKIHDILPTEEAKQKYVAEREHHLHKHHVLIPGLVNMHCHTPMTLFRGFYSDHTTLSQWLSNIVQAEQRWVGPEFVEDGTRIAVGEMLRNGVTCFNDMYFFPEVTARVASSMGMRCNIGVPVIEFPTAWGKGPDEYLEKGLAMAEEFKEDPLVTISLAPHAPYTVNDESFLKVKKLAKEHNMRVHLHLHEEMAKVTESVKVHGVRPIARMERLGIMDSSLIAVHMAQILPEEIDLCAAKGVSVVHCPESNLKLGNGICPIADYISKGVNVCLGTDGAASNDDLDLLGEMRTAALMHRLHAQQTEGVKVLPSFEMLKMATINGAKALGLDHCIGSLEKGKWADLVAIELRTEPVFNPITNLVYVGTNSVSKVWVAGKLMAENGHNIGFDEEALQAKAHQWMEQIVAWEKSVNSSYDEHKD